MDESPALGKVTCFITRRESHGTQLLLLRHPHAGIQIPAGTLEPGEDPVAGALREAQEETSLRGLRDAHWIGTQEEVLPEGQAVMLNAARVYARPDPTAFDWARLPRGIRVMVERQATEFFQVNYSESDRYPDPCYTSCQIKGWVEREVLAFRVRRSFYHIRVQDDTPAQWTHFDDHHLFELFWSPIANLPHTVPPQDRWLAWVVDELHYPLAAG